MKICGAWCSIAVVFLVANLYISFTADKTKLKGAFYETLSKEQIEQYESLVSERRDIYLKGYIFGLILAIAFLFSSRGIKRTFAVNTGIICVVGAIAFVANYLFYVLHPKSTYMVVGLDTEIQRKRWLNIYRHMQVKYHLGLALGIVAAMALAKATC